VSGLVEDTVALAVVTGMVMAVPGPSVLYAVSHALRGGTGSAWWALLGLECGLGVHVLVACLGVGAAVSAAPVALEVLRLLGAGYLALLGVRALCRPAHSTWRQQTVDHTAARVFWGGFTLDVLNPKTLLFCIALLPQFVGSQRAQASVVLVGSTVVAIALVCDGAYAAMAVLLRGRVLPSRLRRWIVRMPGVAFLALAGAALVG
jgi:threonine/homoserine/homoserine lactone efflux protein